MITIARPRRRASLLLTHRPIGRTGTTLSTILWFYLTIVFEGVHPLEIGAFRLKFRRDRRAGMGIEHPLRFYPRYIGETVVKLWKYWDLYRQLKRILADVLADPHRWSYSDLAISQPKDDEFETLDLHHATNGGEAALARKRRDDAIRSSSERVAAGAR